MQISSRFGGNMVFQLIAALEKHIDVDSLATSLQFQKTRANIDPLMLKPKYQVFLTCIYVVVYSFIQIVSPGRRPDYNRYPKTQHFV